jgi:hypothetical protein
MTPGELLEQLSRLCSGQDCRTGEAFSPEATGTDGATQLSPAEIVAHLRSLKRPAILHSTIDSSSLAALVESFDDVSGLTVRESWWFLFRDTHVVSAIVCCGSSFLQARRDLEYRQVEPYLAGFGLRYPKPDEHALIERAAAAVAETQGADVTVDPTEALLNDEIIYVPYGWIGCVGFLVVRSTWTPILLGSGIPLRVHVWAYYRGFADGETNVDRPNDLLVTMVKDPRAARRALVRVGHLPEPVELPFRFRSVDLYFSREALWEAELKGDLRFQVEPPSGAA